MKKLSILLAASFIIFLLSCNREKSNLNPSIIPEPVQMKIMPASFTFDNTTIISVNSNDGSLLALTELFRSELKKGTGIKPDINIQENVVLEKNSISLILNKEEDLKDEAYQLIIEPKHISIKAGTTSGLFYGMQSLYQLFPVDFYGLSETTQSQYKLPCVEIYDEPRFKYRGMHLDVSRHFFPPDFIKRYIDLIAMHKMNRFHWHLTDDNGWRIEIKQYPKLQEISAWRVDREDMPWREVTPPRLGEKETYGGYYSQEEVKEIVEYAKARQITIIPEIEMPGHTCEVLAAYPELSCTGGPFYVQPGSYWPNIDIFCAGKEETFTFIENVLDEVIELFPSKYIHIGGDEANKTNWKTCPDCQKRKKEGLKDEKELQSYLIQRIEKYLNSKGRQIIGWDEILEGGLAPGATVMSWRGMDGGIEAAKKGHDVIMTPTSHCYFDYYQADPEFQPEAIGGFTTLKEIYSFEPIPSELNKEEAKYVLGAQGNVWTEYIKTPSHAEYMSVPRMSALAEVCWSPKDKRNWDRFIESMQKHYQRLDNMGVNYCPGSFGVDINIRKNKEGRLIAVLGSEIFNADIRYTLDGTDPDFNSAKFKQPIKIDSSVVIKAAVFQDGSLMEKPAVKAFEKHMAVNGEIELLSPFHHRYSANGERTLINGIMGSDDFHDGEWLGFYGVDLEAIIDLGEVKPINDLSATFLQHQGAYIFLPDYVQFFYSENGKTYKPLIRVKWKEEQKGRQKIIKSFSQELDGITARYIKVFAKATEVCPEWHSASGEKSWLFIDEIVLK